MCFASPEKLINERNQFISIRAVQPMEKENGKIKHSMPSSILSGAIMNVVGM